jgi:hypothetical protein
MLAPCGSEAGCAAALEADKAKPTSVEKRTTTGRRRAVRLRRCSLIAPRLKSREL